MNARLKLTTAVGVASLLLGATVHAADAPKWYDKVTLGGYVDAYYQQMLTGDAVTVGTATSGRAFDKKVNEFNFGGGELTLTSSDDKSKTGYYLDLLMGPVADVINSPANYPVGSGFMVGQAYVTKTMGDAKFTMGKFGTIIGTEVTSPLSNGNFSRGLVYQSEPVYSVGLKVDYTLPASFVLTGLIDNGNSVDDSISEGKGYGLELAYSGVKNLTTSVSYYGAPSAKTASGISYSDFINFLAAYQAMDTLSFNLEYLYNTTIDTVTNTDPANGPVAFSPKTHGVAVYANWMTPMEGLSVIPRFEQIAQPDTFNAVAMTDSYVYDSYTLTLKYADGPLTHFLEYRADASNNYVFPAAKPTDPSTQSRSTLTYAVAYGF